MTNGLVSRKARYLVEWTPWSEVHAAALKAGMVEGTDSASDFVEIDDFEVSRVFPSLALARSFAKDMLPVDTWSCPRIRRQAWVQNDHDDLGNRVDARPSWETEATWEVFDDTDILTIIDTKPDWTDEAA